MQEESHGNILIVDDTPDNVEVLIRILKRSGYEIHVEEDAQATITHLANAETQPELILLDVMLPGGMNGFELCEKLKADEGTQDIPVIFVSALNHTTDVIHGFDVGAVDYITKPFRAKEVLARVQTHVTLQQQKQEITRLREQDRLYYEKISKIKDDVMHMTSHDLKNPLTNINTAVHLLRRHIQIDDETDRYLQVVESSSQQMHRLIDNILELAKLETGQGLQRRAIQLMPFLQDVLAAFDLTARARDINLHLTPHPDDMVLHADSARIEQVLHNLLSNAIKYTKPGGDVTLSARCEGDYAVLSVADTGIGIPPDALPHLFDKFYRARQADNEDVPEGTGLGLAIVRSIVEQHDGHIWAESEVGSGTTFHIRLPL